MTNNRKTLFIGSVLAVAVLAGIVGPWMFGSDHRQSTNDAYVIADYTVVAPKVAGFIKEVLVEDNQQVKAGQLLATIDARDYQAALDAAQAQLLVAQAQSADARATLERQASLIAQAEAAVKAAQAEAAFATMRSTATAAWPSRVPAPCRTPSRRAAGSTRPAHAWPMPRRHWSRHASRWISLPPRWPVPTAS